ncbi:hypothetical protein [Cupriavidus sp. CuC1]|uniref:hypothetical protein n=1 Tax=Cupriavidus sp. CuC1 TaxID=3373131 RepID=UPI0037CCFEF2
MNTLAASTSPHDTEASNFTPAYSTCTESLPLSNFIGKKAAQLHALLFLISGEGHDQFTRYSAEIQNNVLWLATDLASDLRQLSGELQ